MPAAVVISASPMPAVAARGEAFSANLKEPNVLMMPVTVPRMPSIGSAVMIVERNPKPRWRRLRRPCGSSNGPVSRANVQNASRRSTTSASPTTERTRMGHITGPPSENHLKTSFMLRQTKKTAERFIRNHRPSPASS